MAEPPPPSLRGGPLPRSGEELTLADPERALAVAYAPAHLRAGLTTLFALDERLAGVVASTTEPSIGLIRLAWWREALERLDRGPAPAEPLLAALTARVLAYGITGDALAELEDGWAALLDGEDLVVRHGAARGRLFVAAGRVLSSADPRLAAAGEGWGLADLAHRHSDPAVRMEARAGAVAALSRVEGAWPRSIRALGALVSLARRDVASDTPRQQGSPGRLARMLALRLTGR